MSIRFSEMPGACERHLRRKYNNPLFPSQARGVTQTQVLEAQRVDVDTLHRFLEEFRGLVQQCIDLKPNEESEYILKLKARLDRAYTISAGLYGDQTEVQEALKRLIALIMSAIRQGAVGDALAQRELDQEDAARGFNFELLCYRLVADLMNPESAIEADELVPTLLSESAKAVEAALWLFDAHQLGEMVREGERLLARLAHEGIPVSEARARLVQLQSAYEKETTVSLGQQIEA